MAQHRQLALALALCLSAAALEPARAQPPTTRFQRMQPYVQQLLNMPANTVDGLTAADTDNIKFITVAEKGSTWTYITPSGIAMYKLSVYLFGVFGGNVSAISRQAATKLPKSVVVNLPCYKGNVVINGASQSWSPPDYNMYTTDPAFQAVTKGNLGFFWNPPAGGSITIQAYAKSAAYGGCSTKTDNARPILYNGDRAVDLPLFLFGQDLSGAASQVQPVISATIKNLVLRGSQNIDGSGMKVRPCVSASTLKLLTISGTDFTYCYGLGQGAALELTDTPTTYICNKNKFCKLEGNYAVKNDASMSSFPGAGGALAIFSLAADPKFSGAYLLFKENTHEAMAGAFYIYKASPKAASVKLKSIQVQGNMAPICAGGLTFRQDVFVLPNAGVNTNCNVPGNYIVSTGDPLTLDLTTPNAPSNPNYLWTVNVPGPEVLCGVTARLVQNPCTQDPPGVVDAPYDPNFATKVITSNLVKVITDNLQPPAAFVGLVWAEYAFFQK